MSTAVRCDRCARDVFVVVPYTRDIDTGRVLMRCCAECADEMIVRAMIVVGPDEEADAAEAYR